MSVAASSVAAYVASGEVDVLFSGDDRHASDFGARFTANQHKDWKGKYLNYDLLLASIGAIKKSVRDAEKDFRATLDKEVEEVESFYEELIHELNGSNYFVLLSNQMTDPDDLSLFIQSVENFAVSNLQALKKIVEAHDRCQSTSCSLMSTYSWKLQRDEFCPVEWMDPLLSRLLDLYDRGRSFNGRTEKKGPVQKFTIWVPNNQIIKLCCGLVKRFPVKGSGSRDTFSDPTNSVHFDDEKLTVYKKRVTGENTSLVNFHWGGGASEPSQVAINRRTYPREPGQKVQRAHLPHSRIVSFIQGTDKEEAKNNKREQEVLTSARDEILKSRLRASIKTEYMKTIFQFQDDDSVVCKLSTRVSMIRELDTQKANNWTTPSGKTQEHSIHRFPFALLTIKTRGDGLPKWLNSVLDMKGCKQIKGFSKFIHGSAILYKDIIEDQNLLEPKWTTPYAKYFVSSCNTPGSRHRSTMGGDRGGSTYFGRSHYGNDTGNSIVSRSRAHSISRQGLTVTSRSRAQSAYHISRESNFPGLNTTPFTPHRFSRGASVGEPLKIQLFDRDYSSNVSKSEGLHDDPYIPDAGLPSGLGSNAQDSKMFIDSPKVSVRFKPGSDEETGEGTPLLERASVGAEDTVDVHVAAPVVEEKKLVEKKEKPKAVEKEEDPKVEQSPKESRFDKCYNFFCLSEVTKAKRLTIEPKTFFANERTFLQWFSTATLISSVALALIGVETQQSDLVTVGFIFLPIAMLILIYAFFMFYSRVKKLEARAPSQKYADIWGPALLTLLLVIALFFSMAIETGLLTRTEVATMIDADQYVLPACNVGVNLRYKLEVAGLEAVGNTIVGVASSSAFVMGTAVGSRASYSVPLETSAMGGVLVRTEYEGITALDDGSSLIGVRDPLTGESSVLKVNSDRDVVLGQYTLPSFNYTAPDPTLGTLVGGLSGVALVGENNLYITNNYDNQLYLYELPAGQDSGEAKLRSTVTPVSGAHQLTSVSAFAEGRQLMLVYTEPAMVALLEIEDEKARTVQMYDVPDMPDVSEIAVSGSESAATVYGASIRHDLILKYSWTRESGFSTCLTTSEYPNSKTN